MSLTSAQLDNLIQSKYDLLQQIIARLLDVTVNPRPSYSIDGQSVDFGSYQSMLFDSQKKEIECLDMLIDLQNKVQPYQFVSQGQ